MIIYVHTNSSLCVNNKPSSLTSTDTELSLWSAHVLSSKWVLVLRAGDCTAAASCLPQETEGDSDV